ncbi:c-type cytochrome [Candidatus Poribacteria bacterium]|jgi:hypothetical protein|nr:c-type cytochrome [Candidatus Poribacteria bacterium]MBT5533623.1 c-type cytochrome [Candidatus Poribacteria bacterium]MBT5710543.1 c-type cytochrome [Candidatus Poribacteria bacterium]MBT7096742.1 c-type cytochrome [Candidatus Poribacteria bacterium]MBT7806300.1 c-type cytochrome [Candidatus Poribacteria bacterium]
MRRRTTRLVVAVGVVAAAMAVVKLPTSAQDDADRVARGRYLVDAVASCGQCHTPRKNAAEDPERYLMGHPRSAEAPKFSMDLIRQGVLLSIAPSYTAFSGPWGVTFATNLTPHATGLGSWTEEAFIRAMRTGKHLGDPDKRSMLPPMPWRHYRSITDADLRAIWAYLQSIPPLDNAPPPAKNQLGKPFDQ